MTKRHECLLLAGLGGPLCAGGIRIIEDMIDALPSEADAKWRVHQKWNESTDEILARAKALGKPATISLIGHSYGAWKIIEMAMRLKTHGLAVDYLAGIDPTALPAGADPMVIPSNVKHCDEFWASRGWPAMARWRDPTGGAGGMYTNPNAVSHKLMKFSSGHVALARNAEVQKRIVGKVAELVA